MTIPSDPSSFVEPTGYFERLLSKNWMIGALLLVSVALISATAYRTVNNYAVPSNTLDWENRGHSDFHNGVYFPAKSFRNGINPYSPKVMEKYPVASSFRPCPPITFMMHVPFTYLEVETSDVLFFAYNTCLLLALAFTAVIVGRGQFHLGWWLLVSAALLLSRPGHVSLFTGYYTLELVLGVLVALHYGKTKPWLSALGMLIASAKPTFILPLILVMVARKNFRATILGLVICVVVGVGGLAWLAKDSSFTEVVQGISAGQKAFHTEDTELPINTWTRIDLLGMIAKFTNWVPNDTTYLASMFAFAFLPCLVIWKTAEQDQHSGLTGVSSTIGLLTILLVIYHHSYDCLLAVIPWVAVAFFPSNVMPEIGLRSKQLLAVSLTIPLFNYLSTLTAKNLLGFEQTNLIWQLITIVNGLCLFISLLIVLNSARQLIAANDRRTGAC